jgi:hypothetical protein
MSRASRSPASFLREVLRFRQRFPPIFDRPRQRRASVEDFPVVSRGQVLIGAPRSLQDLVRLTSSAAQQILGRRLEPPDGPKYFTALGRESKMVHDRALVQARASWCRLPPARRNTLAVRVGELLPGVLMPPWLADTAYGSLELAYLLDALNLPRVMRVHVDTTRMLTDEGSTRQVRRVFPLTVEHLDAVRAVVDLVADKERAKARECFRRHFGAAPQKVLDSETASDLRRALEYCLSRRGWEQRMRRCPECSVYFLDDHPRALQRFCGERCKSRSTSRALRLRRRARVIPAE